MDISIVCDSAILQNLIHLVRVKGVHNLTLKSAVLNCWLADFVDNLSAPILNNVSTSRHQPPAVHISSPEFQEPQDISRHLRTSQDHKKCVVKMGLGRPNCPHDRWEMSPGKTYMSYVWVLTSESLPLSNLTCLTSNSLDALAKLAEVIRPRW